MSAAAATAIGVSLATAVAVMTFGEHVDAVVDEPARYGWAWDTTVTCNQGYCGGGIFATDAVLEVLGDPAVTAWGYGYFAQALRFGEELVTAVTSVSERGDVEIATVLDGRSPTADDEIAFGSDTLERLGVDIGSTVTTSGGTRLRVVGRAVFAGFGPVDQTRATLGDGAVLTPTGLQAALGFPAIPNALVVETDGRLDEEDLTARLAGLTVLDPSPPGSLAAWESIRWFPSVAAAAFSALAIAAIVHFLALSHRMRRRDFAILVALGCRRAQLARATAAHAAALVVTCALVAIPVGLAAGRAAWDRYAVALGVDAGSVSIPLGVVAVVAIVFSLSQLAAATTSRHVTTHAAEKVREQEFTLAASR